MCGRYSLRTPVQELDRTFGFAERPNLVPRYNIAPTQDVPAVRPGEGGRRLVSLRWGLVPSWAKDPSIGSRLINARAETVAEKPAFRDAFRRRRCLILADGFYEWQTIGGAKLPWRIALENDVPFAFAGLWERWTDPKGAAVESCTIVTTDAAPAIAAIHPRMPVILDPQDHDTWLVAEPGAVAALLHPYRGALTAYPVGSRVNSVRNDDAGLIEPVEEVAEEPQPASGQLDLF